MTPAASAPEIGTAIHVFDDVLSAPQRYRAQALGLPFGDVPVGDQVFRGIAPAPDDRLADVIRQTWRPDARTTVSFFRKSPQGQQEPNFIHSDVEMGQWTAVLYLHPDPPAGDGTSFWRYVATDAVRGGFDVHASHAAEQWERWHHVDAKFNRLLIFESDLFHSRGLLENYGEGNDARLIQVAFGRLGGRTTTIRDATPEDVPALIAMAQRFVALTEYQGLLTISPERMAQTLRALLSNPDALVLVAEQDGVAVGMVALLSYAHHYSTDRVASELVWWVDPEHRGTAGSRLLARAERWAQAQGAVLQMIAPNDRVAQLYERMGYTRVEVAYQRRF